MGLNRPRQRTTGLECIEWRVDVGHFKNLPRPFGHTQQQSCSCIQHHTLSVNCSACYPVNPLRQVNPGQVRMLLAPGIVALHTSATGRNIGQMQALGSQDHVYICEIVNAAALHAWCFTHSCKNRHFHEYSGRLTSMQESQHACGGSQNCAVA